MSDDLSEYEAELADIVDPSPWEDTPHVDHGRDVLNGMADALVAMSKDIAAVMNEGGPPMVQYLVAKTGYSVSGSLVDPTHIHIVVEFPGGFVVQ